VGEGHGDWIAVPQPSLQVTRFVNLMVENPAQEARNTACGSLGGPNGLYTHFDRGSGTINIERDEYAGGDYTLAFGKDGNFTHELYHLVCEGNGTVPLNQSWSSEMLATFAEYVGGNAWPYLVQPNYDYDISFIPSGDDTDSTEYCGTYVDFFGSLACKYNEYRLFGAYLHHQFPGPSSVSQKDDLIYSWIRNLPEESGGKSVQDLWGLSLYLEDPDTLESYYVSRLGIPTVTGRGDLRVQKIFNQYGLARFLDNSSPSFYDGVYGFPSGVSPTGTFGIFTFGGMSSGWKAALTVPPEIVLGSAFVSAGIDTLEGDWHDPSYPGGRGEPTKLRAWSTDYIAFRADSAAFSSVSDQSLVVTIQGSVPTGHKVFVNYITYDTYEGDLFTHGDDAVTVFDGAASIVYPNTYGIAAIPNFGDSVKSAVISITMVEDPIGSASNSNPASLSYKAIYRLASVSSTPEQPAPSPSKPSHALVSVAPHPFLTSTKVTYRIQEDGKDHRVQLSVFDVAGRLCRSLGLDGTGGTHTTVWDGRVDSSARAQTGVYFFRLSVDGVPIGQRKVLLSN
jgi:hypothetical protein